VGSGIDPAIEVTGFGLYKPPFFHVQCTNCGHNGLVNCSELYLLYCCFRKAHSPNQTGLSLLQLQLQYECKLQTIVSGLTIAIATVYIYTVRIGALKTSSQLQSRLIHVQVVVHLLLHGFSVTPLFK